MPKRECVQCAAAFSPRALAPHVRGRAGRAIVKAKARRRAAALHHSAPAAAAPATMAGGRPTLACCLDSTRGSGGALPLGRDALGDGHRGEHMTEDTQGTRTQCRAYSRGGRRQAHWPPEANLRSPEGRAAGGGPPNRAPRRQRGLGVGAGRRPAGRPADNDPRFNTAARGQPPGSTETKEANRPARITNRGAFCHKCMTTGARQPPKRATQIEGATGRPAERLFITLK